MSTEAQTQAIPRVLAGNVASPDVDVAREDSVQHMYAAGLAKLEALHGHWAAAVAEIRQVPASGESGAAAA